MTKYLIKTVSTATKENDKWYNKTSDILNIKNGQTVYYIGKGSKVISGLCEYYAFARKSAAEQWIKKFNDWGWNDKNWATSYEVVGFECEG